MTCTILGKILGHIAMALSFRGSKDDALVMMLLLDFWSIFHICGQQDSNTIHETQTIPFFGIENKMTDIDFS